MKSKITSKDKQRPENQSRPNHYKLCTVLIPQPSILFSKVLLVTFWLNLRQISFKSTVFFSIIANEVYNKYTTFKLQLNRKLSFFHMWNALRQFSNKEKRGITQTSRYKCVFPYLQEGIMTRAVFPALSWQLHKVFFVRYADHESVHGFSFVTDSCCWVIALFFLSCVLDTEWLLCVIMN